MTEAPEIVVRGVTLTEYAFLRAGLADGLAAEELLGFLRLDAEAWAAAEEAWEDRILDAVGDMDAALLDELDARMAEARTHWTRRVPPLDDDVRAWFAFLHAWQSDAEPADFLQRMGLGTAEVAYLHRHWSERMAKDDKLREEALALLGQDLGEPPVPVPEPPRLRKRPEAEPARGYATEELAFGKGRTLPFAEGEPGPMPPPLAVPLPARKRPRMTAPGVQETALLRAPPVEAPLPFEPAEADAPRPGAEPSVQVEPASELTSAAPPIVAFQAASPDTSLAPSIGTLPPSPAARAGAPPFVAPTADAPARARPTVRIEVVEPSPFDEEPTSPDPPPRAVAGGDTAPLPATEVPTGTGAPLPFAPAVRTVALIAGTPEETVAVEVASGTVMPLPSAFGPLPALSLEQHARLYAELTTTPEQAPQTLERYGLTPETKKAEDDFWQAEFTRDPAKRATWLRVCAAARMKRRKGEEPK
jgi:hypothetical protein